MQDGSYCARLPWKESHLPLPSNFSIWYKRTRSLADRLTQIPELLFTYHRVIVNQLKRGFVELVDTSKKPNKEYYICHHCVKTNSTKTPIRIIYDCSCQQSDKQPSLNDCLHIGPPFLNDLCSILLCYCTHNYAISTDIEKAFPTSAFKRKTGTVPTSSGFRILQILTVSLLHSVHFGVVNSSFILHATLHHHLPYYNTLLSNNIQSNLYVDNAVCQRFKLLNISTCQRHHVQCKIQSQSMGIELPTA